MEKKETIVEAAETRAKLEVMGEEVITTVGVKGYIIDLYDECKKLWKHNKSKKHAYLPDLTFEDGIQLAWELALDILRESESENTRYYSNDMLSRDNSFMER